MDLHPFLLALLGGVLIGGASALLLLFNGRIAGISGVVGGLFGRLFGGSGAVEDRGGWRMAFTAGLLAGGALLAALFPSAFGTPVVGGIALPVVAGLLVGFGTRLGSGCTSGHGVCGLARGSTRSLTATLTFMAAAGITVFVVRHVLGSGGH